jgi:ParB family chromosome partitioning protein
LKSSAKNIKLTSYDELFQPDAARENAQGEKVMEIPLAELHHFRNHPFQVKQDQALLDMAESIREYGVLSPGLARPMQDDGYEVISGNRRLEACILAGLETMPVIVRNMTDDEAVIAMVDANLQRESLLFSERAFAYKMKLEAMKRQAGRPSKENATQVGQDLRGKYSVEILAEQSGESRNQIQRYIRLTELTPELLDMVDTKKIAFNPAVELSYLNKEEQALLLDAIAKQEATPSLSQAQRLKKYSQEGKLSADVMDAIMSEEKKGELDKVTLTGDKIKKYFPKSYTPQQMEATIIKLLEGWARKRQQEQER